MQQPWNETNKSEDTGRSNDVTFKKDNNDILYLPHHQSAKYPRMPILKRAAQFAAFAALNGYEEAIAEASRSSSEKIALSDDEKSLLNISLCWLQENIERNPKVKLVYFVPDSRKNGGIYKTMIDNVKSVDTQRQVLRSSGNIEIEFKDIYSIEILST